MAEGGQLPWKRQVIDQHRGPPGDYTCISRGIPLPPPPGGTRWERDRATGEWSLVGSQSRKGGAAAAAGLGGIRGADGGEEGEWESGSPSHEDEDEDGSLPKKIIEESTLIAPPGAVEGVDYVTHTVLPTDTFPGLCLRYAITPINLRRANRFSGTNLRLAPSKLIVPLGKGGADVRRIRLQDRESEEFKTHAFLSDFPGLSASEARAYLLMSGFDLEGAKAEARGDAEWERSRSRSASGSRGTARGGGGGAGSDGRGCDGGRHDPTLHVHVAVPALPPGDEGGGWDAPAPAPAADGGEERQLRAPLLRRELELPRVG